MTETDPAGVERLEIELLRQKRLNDASVLLHTTLDLDELLKMILDAACEGVEADRGTVFLMKEDGSELWSRVLRGDQALEIRLPVGKGIAGSVAETGETVRIEDAYEDERFDQSWDKASGYRTRQMLCKAIVNREGRTTGVFQLLNKREGPFDDADEAYLDSLSIHAALALENAQLHLSAIEQERTAREILLVQDVQRAYQPERASLTFGKAHVAGMNILCEDASGDYYDFIPLDDDKHVIVVGDVSGHGLKSALVMAQARAFLRAYCTTVDDLATVVDRLDASLAHDLARGLFMCAAIATLDGETGEMRWVNAGHPPPLVVRAADGSIEQLNSTGRILGILPDPSHVEGEPVTLQPGDAVLLYTDGITEARNPEGEMVEEERLTEALAKVAGADAEEILEKLRDHLTEWCGSDQLEDDLTMVAIKFGG